MLATLYFEASALILPSKYNPFEIDGNYSEDGQTFRITAVKKDFKDYTLVFFFTELENTFGKPSEVVVLRGNADLFKFTPIKTDEPFGVGYTYHYYPYWINPDKVKEDFVYRLPFDESKSYEVRDLYNLNKDLGKKIESKNWRAFEFVMEEDADVYAVRKGIVTEIQDGNDRVIDGASYSSHNNQITVQHSDGTIAMYSYLKNGSMTVKEGDVVYPNMAIAKAGNVGGKQYELRLQIYYFTSKDLENLDSKDRAEITDVYINPIFSTSEGNIKLTARQKYTPLVTEKLITAEMTKREIKSLKNSK